MELRLQLLILMQGVIKQQKSTWYETMRIHNSNTQLQNEYNKTNYRNNILLKVLADTVEFCQQFISEGICKKKEKKRKADCFETEPHPFQRTGRFGLHWNILKKILSFTFKIRRKWYKKKNTSVQSCKIVFFLVCFVSPLAFSDYCTLLR